MNEYPLFVFSKYLYQPKYSITTPNNITDINNCFLDKAFTAPFNIGENSIKQKYDTTNHQ